MLPKPTSTGAAPALLAARVPPCRTDARQQPLPTQPRYPLAGPSLRPAWRATTATEQCRRYLSPRLLLRQMFTVALAVGNSIRSSGA